MNSKTFDQIILEPGFPLEGAHFVEASAGTGKTYNIQNIYARIIMEKGYKVSEIQVMTYTEAATKELHDRLHGVLKDLQARFSDPVQPCAGKDERDRRNRAERADRLIAALPTDARSRARFNVELALLEFDNAAISTIHGFCQRILSRYAFDAGIDLAPEVGKDDGAELERRAEDWWRKRPADAPPEITLADLKKCVRILSARSSCQVKEQSTNNTGSYLLREAQKLVDRYESERPLRDKISFDDLLRALRDALKSDRPGSRKLLAKLHQECKAALIDEFQDTDPVQYEIFEKIFLDAPDHPLFFVGDPKQAIYAFRGGDIYTYLTAKERPGQNLFSLNVNHRSTRRLIDAVNGMFMDEEIPGKASVYTFGDGRIGYRTPLRVEEDPSVRRMLDKPLRIIEMPPSTGSRGPSISADMPAIIELLTEQLLAVLHEKDECGNLLYSPKDVAILSNSNQRNAELREALAVKGIPAVIRNSGNVFASPAAIQLRTFLQAVLDPDDRLTVRGALITDFAGENWETLPDQEDQEALARAVEKFSALKSKWHNSGFAALAAELERGGYRERFAQRADGERLLADVEQIFELAFAAIKQLGHAPERLLAWLTDRIECGSDNGPAWGGSGDHDEKDAEEYSRELESDEDAVKIMTVHASKGLQFPVVLLPDCWNLTYLRQSLPVAYHSGSRIIVSPDDKDKVFSKGEFLQERTRLLYVALTRAVERIVLFTPPLAQLKSAEPLTRLIDNLKKRTADAPPYELLPSAKARFAGEYSPQQTESAALSALPPRHFDLSPSKGSYSSLSPSLHAELSDDDGRDEDQSALRFPEPQQEPLPTHPIFAIRGGAAIGSCWHNVLEKLPFDAEDPEIRRLAEKELTDCGFIRQEHIVDDTLQMLRKVLEFPLTAPDGEKFSLCQIPWHERLSEQEFNFSTARSLPKTPALKAILNRYWENDPDKAEFLRAMTGWDKEIPRGFMTGFIDLIFRRGNCFYVVDWKSNSLDGTTESFNADGIIREMAIHGYFFQYLLYAVVLHRYLKQIMGSTYSWKKNFGGIRYFFLRGIAAGGSAPVFADRPEEKLLDELAEALGLEVR